jgi:hypothetical protein
MHYRKGAKLSWWLTPAILVTWEAEIRMIQVQDQPRQINPSPK